MKFLIILLLSLSLSILISCNNKIEESKVSQFRYSVAEPLKPNILEKGKIEKDEIVKIFNEFPWKQYLEQIKNSKDGKIYYSPSLEFENSGNKNGLAISAVGEPDSFEFYVFYKRPKKGNTNENNVSDLTGQSKEDVLTYLNALINNDLHYLESKFK